MAKSKSIKAAPKSVNDAPTQIIRDVILNLGENMVFRLLIEASPDTASYYATISTEHNNGKTYSLMGSLKTMGV